MPSSQQFTLPVVTFDTCVLMHSFTRKLLLQLSKQSLFFPIWSEEIGIEWRRNAPRIWHVERRVVEQEWESMQTAFPLANMGEVAPFYTPINEHLYPTQAETADNLHTSTPITTPVQNSVKTLHAPSQIDTSHTRLEDKTDLTHAKVLYYRLQPANTSHLQNYLFKRIDKKDRHIALCALLAGQRFHAKQNILLTWNIGDFHRRELREFGIELKTPDSYLSELFAEHHELINTACLFLHQEHLTLGRHPYTLVELLKREKLYRLANLLDSLSR